MLRETLGRIPVVYRAVNRLRGTRLHEPDTILPHVMLGRRGYEWPLPTDILGPDCVVYTFGVGKDVSFDLAVIDKIGCTVHAFDPTPTAMDWIATQNLPERFVFHAAGLAGTDGEEAFEAPSSGRSFRRASGESSQTVRCPVKRLSTLAGALGHDHVDLAKLDIEGFEYPVLDDILQHGPLPRFLNIEFHHGDYGISPNMTRHAVDHLRQAGYRCYWMSDWGREYGFVRQQPGTN